MSARRINLLPSDLKERRRSRQTATALVAGVAILVGVLGVVYASQEIRLRAERGTLADQQEDNATLRAQVAELREFETLEEELRDKQQLVEEVSAQEVRWSVLLADISLVIPSDVWLTSLTGQVTQRAADQEEQEGPVTLGTIQMAGTTFTHPDVARWLTRLASVDALRLPYISLSTKAAIGETPVVNFSSSVQLSQAAFRRNQRGARRTL
jgi:Tfp pilus assembly protein PilN